MISFASSAGFLHTRQLPLQGTALAAHLKAGSTKQRACEMSSRAGRDRELSKIERAALLPSQHPVLQKPSAVKLADWDHQKCAKAAHLEGVAAVIRKHEDDHLLVQFRQHPEGISEHSSGSPFLFFLNDSPFPSSFSIIQLSHDDHKEHLSPASIPFAFARSFEKISAHMPSIIQSPLSFSNNHLRDRVRHFRLTANKTRFTGERNAFWHSTHREQH